MAKAFNTPVISALGYTIRHEDGRGDITYTVNSQTDGKGKAGFFQITRPDGSSSGRIGSVTMNANGKVTFRAAEAPTGTRIRPTIIFDNKKDKDK